MRKLRRLRAEKGLTMDALEERTGVSKRTISELERGMRTPHTLTLAKLAAGLGVDLDDLEEEVNEAPKVLRPQSLEELLHRGGLSSHWLTLTDDEFANWWLNVGRAEAIRRREEIRAEYEVIAAEWRAIQEGKSTVAPELQAEIRQRMPKFVAKNLVAGAGAPGRAETEAEFHERQNRRELRQASLKSLEEDLKRTFPDAV